MTVLEKAGWLLAASCVLGCDSGGKGSAGTPLPPLPPLVGGEDTASSASVGVPERRVLAFEEVAERVGLVGEQHKGEENCPTFLGSGSAWGDVDLDGDCDLFATNHGGPNFLYENRGDQDGDRLPDFVDIAGTLGIQQADKFSHAAVFVDYDNDGDQDLYVTNLRVGNTLWKSRRMEDGALSFVDATSFAGVADDGRAVTSAWGDIDRDGFLDFYLAKHAKCLTDPAPRPGQRLFHARGDGSFEDWTRLLCSDGTRTCDNVNGLGFAAAFLDHDNDGDADLYLVNDATHGGGPNRHWRNDGPDGLGGWLLPEVSAALGTNTRLNGMGLGVGDLDNDGWLDLAFSNIEESHVLRNREDGSYEDITYTCGIFDATRLSTGWGTVFLDADSDGWLDLFFANGSIWGGLPEPDTLLRNNGDLTFQDVSLECGLAGERKGRNTSLCDLDRDGYVDLFVGNLGQQPYLYHNLSGARHSTQHWLVVTVEGTLSNRDGIGTRITLRTLHSTQIREITSGPSHGGGDERAAFFGLGDETFAQLSLRWPSGIGQDLGLVNANQRLHVLEPTR
ncbi:MAG: CRTAC1 family protein [Planctomycetes bacterium]|nr:CRTAC1 family protein [Planctomycetota bacterium]